VGWGPRGTGPGQRGHITGVLEGLPGVVVSGRRLMHPRQCCHVNWTLAALTVNFNRVFCKNILI